MKPPKGDLTVLASCTCVCFDVDSTVSVEEGIDVLASFAGVSDQVSALTRRAMSGDTSFETSLRERLALIRPTRRLIAACKATNPPRLTPGALELITYLHKRGTRVYLISGGFTEFVLPVAAALSIPPCRVIANRFVFSSHDDDLDSPVVGVDPSVPTSASGGKALAVASIRSAEQAEAAQKDSEAGFAQLKIAMVGDGITDLEACPPADVFVGFGGVVVRDVVYDRSTHFATSFGEILAALQTVDSPPALLN